ncbi:hypothetical protein OGATHE_000923 [Ogataea polymorpha]|uniref:Uncharacterized protein n=1 Tax=Ogataea polymorpha TaxID=460523 RepID=A0A9P8TG22_9ASCO|nr:hypothetical protein OGATHE_000923 [Ogataea polymorpha]
MGFWAFASLSPSLPFNALTKSFAEDPKYSYSKVESNSSPIKEASMLELSHLFLNFAFKQGASCLGFVPIKSS